MVDLLYHPSLDSEPARYFSMGPTQDIKQVRDSGYQASRWRKLQLAVLRRDGYRCWVTGCYRTADVVDHIDRVTAATTDAAFHDPRRLRASCRNHNVARGVAGGDLLTSTRAAGPDPEPDPLDTIRRDYTARPQFAAGPDRQRGGGAALTATRRGAYHAVG